jgi:hypothetical protein
MKPVEFPGRFNDYMNANEPPFVKRFITRKYTDSIRIADYTNLVKLPSNLRLTPRDI